VLDKLLTRTIAADESLKFWKIFEKKAGAGAGVGGSSSTGKADMAKQMTIR
jgi:cell division cycle 20, cofactor of APC complex